MDIGSELRDRVLDILEAGWTRATGYERMCHEVGEVRITECLRSGMREALSERFADWCKNMTILPGTEYRSESSASLPEGITDIPIFFQNIRHAYDDHEPHAIIECKRISGGNANLCRLYVVEGIDRFRTGKYAARHVIAFMAGYMLTGDATAAATGINRYLSRRRRESEHLSYASSVGTASVWISSHPRPGQAVGCGSFRTTIKVNRGELRNIFEGSTRGLAAHNSRCRFVPLKSSLTGGASPCGRLRHQRP